MIVGAQKAGTTSFKNYLGQHPALTTHYQKEFAYFVDDSEFQSGYPEALSKYFPKYDQNSILIAKSAGLYIHEPGLKRLKEHNPDCKLVFILRNPVERTYSSYLMEKNYGAIREPVDVIDKIIQKKDSTDWRYEFFIGMSLYAHHLEIVYRYFPKEQVRLIRFEDLISTPANYCKNIFEWMGLDSDFVPDTTVRHNETTVTRSQTYGKILLRVLSNKNPLKSVMRHILPGQMDYRVGEAMRRINRTEKKYDPIPEKTLLKLLHFFEAHNNKLSQMTGLDFSSWNNKPE